MWLHNKLRSVLLEAIHPGLAGRLKVFVEVCGTQILFWNDSPKIVGGMDHKRGRSKAPAEV